jgi:hypothetical protein
MAARSILDATLALLMIAAPTEASAQGLRSARTFRLDSVEGLALENVSADVVTYRGRKAVHLLVREGAVTPGYQARGDALAVILGTSLQDGVIEVDLAGAPQAGASEGARGFVGIAFRIAPNAAGFECFYLRPTNGRAEDQLRRNHSTQYISWPDYPWERLRKENPGQYESYVDLEAGVWTHLKIVVQGAKARLFVNGASEPTLVVNDLKLGAGAPGQVALWIGAETEAYFSNLTLR